MQLALARSEGIYAEASSVLTLAVVKKLRQRGEITPGDTVVALLTAGGLKDPEVSQTSLPGIPSIRPTLDDLERGLRDHYEFPLRLSGGIVSGSSIDTYSNTP